MRIVDKSYPVVSFEAFADEHELTIVINERPSSYKLPRYFAAFEHVEVMERGCLASICGDGDTKVEAIRNYAARLAGERIAVDAYTDKRREIQCPNEWQAT